jgi:hypothetical protein
MPKSWQEWGGIQASHQLEKVSMKTSFRAQVAPFLAMDILAEANKMEAEGRRVFHLEAGQPGGKGPKPALEAARNALLHDPLGYTEALGRPALKAAIAARYADQYGIDIDPRRVVITTGSSAGFILSFLTMFDAGQSLVIANPGYPAYRNTAIALNLKPIGVRAGSESGFQIPAGGLREIDGAHGLLIASPGNPTGTVTAGDLRREELVFDLRRNLPWPDIRAFRRDSANVCAGCNRDQQLLKILCDDRMAHRLDGRAGGSGPARRTSGAKSIHIAANDFPSGGSCGPDARVN